VILFLGKCAETEHPTTGKVEKREIPSKFLESASAPTEHSKIPKKQRGSRDGVEVAGCVAVERGGAKTVEV
jgi:hypothetical protein